MQINKLLSAQVKYIQFFNCPWLLQSFTLGWQLDEASRKGEESEVQDLLQRGADPNSAWRPLHWARFNNHSSCASLLIQGGASLNFTDSLGQTALHYACMSNSIDSVTLLLSHNSPIGEPIGFCPVYSDCSNVWHCMCMTNNSHAVTVREIYKTYTW